MENMDIAQVVARVVVNGKKELKGMTVKDLIKIHNQMGDTSIRKMLKSTIIVDKLRKENGARKKAFAREVALRNDIMHFITHRTYKRFILRTKANGDLELSEKDLKLGIFAVDSECKALRKEHTNESIQRGTIAKDADYRRLLSLFTDNIGLWYGEVLPDSGVPEITGVLCYRHERANFLAFTRNALRNQMNIIYAMLVGTGYKIHPKGSDIDYVISRSSSTILYSDVSRVTKEARVIDLIFDTLEPRLNELHRKESAPTQ